MKILEMNHVKKGFDGHGVLKDISLSVEKGEVVSIIGPSGSGKSTQLRCATMLEKMDDGELVYLGQKVTAASTRAELKKIRSCFGLVFQNFNLFPHYNVMKHITDALIHVDKISKKEAVERAEKLLAQLGLSDKADAYPCQLSGGQQQRICIARALAVSPRYIVFDESISGLDVILRKSILELLKRVQEEEQCCYLFITHEIDAALYLADEIHVMQNGKLIESRQWNGDLKIFQNPYTKQLLRASHLI